MKKTAFIFCLLMYSSSIGLAAGVGDGATQVNFSVKVMEGAKDVATYTVTTIEGVPVPIQVSRDVSFIAEARTGGIETGLTPGIIKTGLFISLNPVVAKSGKVVIALVAKKSDVMAIDNFKKDGLEIQLPEVKSIGLEQMIVVDDGEEVSIPFGSMNTESPAGSKYSIKIGASKT